MNPDQTDEPIETVTVEGTRLPPIWVMLAFGLAAVLIARKLLAR